MALGLIAAALVGMIVTSGAAAAPVSAQEWDGEPAGADVVDVVEISGHLDGIVANFIERSIRRAESEGSIALVLQVDSPRAVIDDERLAELADAITGSAVPVTMWVGPSGAEAKGGLAQLAGVVDDLALAPGSRLGNAGTAAFELPETFAAAYPRMTDGTISSTEAIQLGLAREAPTLPFFVLDLPGFRTEIDTTGDEPVRVPLSRVRFAKLPLLDQYMHTAASPAVAYLLLLSAGVLLIFELYTAGVGVAGVVGAGSLLLGGYGLAAQPFGWLGVILLLLAAFGYCVDIQTGVPRVWTVIATVSLVAGSLTLFEGGSPGWVPLVAGILGVVLAMTVGMPAMVRARFSLPTIGREWMIGADGVAVEGLDPEGVVEIDGAPWRARTHRAHTVEAGDPVRVVSLEGLVLTVAPPEDSD